MSSVSTDVLVIGAGAAGLMCAFEAGKRGRSVIVLDHANKAGKKILMSGGGRCNFTNLDIDPDNYISHNPHFCKSAFSRYTQWDFIAMVERHGIAYHEKHLGQLFCNESSRDILDMLLTECADANAEVCLNSEIQSVTHKPEDGFIIETATTRYQAESLVVACGGLSIPKMCASPLGYRIAEQFGHNIWPMSAGLVPFTLQPQDKEKFEVLSGVSIDSLVSNESIQFRENILFTHRGLSGPAVLQISSYWQAGEAVEINLLPDIKLFEYLTGKRDQAPNTSLKTVLAELLPRKCLPVFIQQSILEKPLQELSQEAMREISAQLQQWQVSPNATEGYRTAEVTLGGVDCDQLSSRTMESKKLNGLYFIGEVVDVTGWLGGYNFQWAWSSGWCAGQVV